MKKLCRRGKNKNEWWKESLLVFMSSKMASFFFSYLNGISYFLNTTKTTYIGLPFPLNYTAFHPFSA
jgi:hypothetical protein